MGGDGEESVALESVGFDNLLSEFEEKSDALAASCKEIVN